MYFQPNFRLMFDKNPKTEDELQQTATFFHPDEQAVPDLASSQYRSPPQSKLKSTDNRPPKPGGELQSTAKKAIPMDAKRPGVKYTVKRQSETIERPSQNRQSTSLQASKQLTPQPSKATLLPTSMLSPPVPPRQSPPMTEQTQRPEDYNAFIENHQRYLQQIQQQQKQHMEHFNLKKYQSKPKLEVMQISVSDLRESEQSIPSSVQESKVFRQTNEFNNPFRQTQKFTGSILLPRISSGKKLPIVVPDMRKSKTAQEAQREQQQQQQQSLVKHESNLVLPNLNSPQSGTLQGFGSTKQGKKFVTRRPQAQIVSRIFSSKSDKI